MVTPIFWDMQNGSLWYIFIISLYFYMLLITSPVIMPIQKWIISYFFFPHRAAFFSVLWSFSSPSSKTPFKSVIILFFSDEVKTLLGLGSIILIIIFMLLFPIPFTKQTNSLFASLSSLCIFPWIAAACRGASRHSCALFSFLANVVN